MSKDKIDFNSISKEILSVARPIEGYLADGEIVFLTMAALYPTASGLVLEIGSFKGKSTIVLAKSTMAISPQEKIVAVDPMTSPSQTDPNLKGLKSCFDYFQTNVRQAGVEKNVEFHQMLSSDLAKDWDRKIRFLWIDGDHTYKGAHTDLELFLPHLADGAIVAFHDLLHRFEGPDRVFAESILLSENFGPFGICRSIGWAQYFLDTDTTRRFRSEKLRLYRKLCRIIPFSALNPPANHSGLAKMKYKLFRALIPHAAITPDQWLGRIIIPK
jgi:predicted O-methyltransferase YrrM